MLTRIGNAQNRVLAQVLQSISGSTACSRRGDGKESRPTSTRSAEMLDDLQRGIWSELWTRRAEDRSVSPHATEQLSDADEREAEPEPGAGGADRAARGTRRSRSTPLAEDARSEIRGEAGRAQRARCGRRRERRRIAKRGCISPAWITGSGRYSTRSARN